MRYKNIFIASIILTFLSGCDDNSSNIKNSTTDSVDPLINSWIMGNGVTGYNGEPANVVSISITDEHIIVKSSGIPSYDIGKPNGWKGNPSKPVAQNHTFYILRNPKEETGTKTATPLGPIGVLTNGVPIFSALDARSYNNMNIWHQNAHYWEGDGMDSCNGHPAPGRMDMTKGAYHHHFYPVCLLNIHYTSYDSTKHSPIIGWAFDGFPIYGPYGYANSDGIGGVMLIKSSYRARNITQRHTLPDGTQLNSSQYGPDVSNNYPLGAYAEDFEYVAGSGYLDEYNGHFTITPEYQNGIYHYHVIINQEKNDGVYPFFIGPKYYGVVETRNFPSPPNLNN